MSFGNEEVLEELEQSAGFLPAGGTRLAEFYGDVGHGHRGLVGFAILNRSRSHNPRPPRQKDREQERRRKGEWAKKKRRSLGPLGRVPCCSVCKKPGHYRRTCPVADPKRPNPIVQCQCGCGGAFTKFDRNWRARSFISGHNRPWRMRKVGVFDSASADSAAWLQRAV